MLAAQKIHMLSGSIFCAGVLNRQWARSRVFDILQPWRSRCEVKMWAVSTSTSKRLTRASLEPFQYTTMAGLLVRPNCAVNYLEAVGSSSADGASRGRGAAYRAACDRAHFYVQANKYGTLFTETDWAMQTNFRVQARWFDDLVARGKLSRDQWLQYAADTTVGFSSRKRNFEALEVYEKEKAMDVDAAELREKIASACPKKPWRPDLLQQAKAGGYTRLF